MFLTVYYLMSAFMIYCLVKGYFCRGGINQDLRYNVLNRKISFVLIILIFEGPNFVNSVQGYIIHFTDEGWLDY